MRDSLTLFEVKRGVNFSHASLMAMLPDVETTLFFGKLFKLDHIQLSALLRLTCRTDLASALLGEADGHSSELQDYLVDIADMAGVELGDTTFGEAPPMGEILPAVWESLQVEIASAIQQVADKLTDVVGLLPGKQGEMVFSSLMKMNAKRPTIGDYRASIHHQPQKENLVILDVSGSMTEGAVRRIVDDVVAMSYNANAHFAIVSNTCSYWAPGSYSVDDILARAEFGGTRYEELTPLFDRDWGTVITIADYDSSRSAKEHIGNYAVGSIDTVLDISLVNRPTYLAECVGQLAAEVRPLLVATGSYPLSH